MFTKQNNKFTDTLCLERKTVSLQTRYVYTTKTKLQNKSSQTGCVYKTKMYTQVMFTKQNNKKLKLYKHVMFTKPNITDKLCLQNKTKVYKHVMFTKQNTKQKVYKHVMFIKQKVYIQVTFTKQKQNKKVYRPVRFTKQKFTNTLCLQNKNVMFTKQNNIKKKAYKHVMFIKQKVYIQVMFTKQNKTKCLHTSYVYKTNKCLQNKKLQ